MADRLFYNVDGSWGQNLDINGSPMIRPHFGQSEDITTGVNGEILNDPFMVYPNPVNSHLNIVGQFENVILYDLHGQVIKHLKNHSKRIPACIDVSCNKPGLYILEITNQNQRQIEKIWIEH
jgi:hypothetical protein